MTVIEILDPFIETIKSGYRGEKVIGFGMWDEDQGEVVVLGTQDLVQLSAEVVEEKGVTDPF